jgi:hypothetical protein
MHGIKEYRGKLVTADDPATLYALLEEISEVFSALEFI